MSAIKVKFEIGHESMLRPEQSPNVLHHIFDWEVYVRGPDDIDISSFVDYVVFNLHGTFQKPRRVVKEPPFSVRETGYASFNIPIEIYLRNKEKRKIKFLYDLNLEHNGFIEEQYIFRKPTDAFKKKLLLGGGIIMLMSEIDSENNHEDRDSSPEQKQELTIMPASSNNASKRSSSPNLPETRDPSEKPKNKDNPKRRRNTIDVKPCQLCDTFVNNLSTEQSDKRNEIFGQLLVEELKQVKPCLRTHMYSKILKFIHSSKTLHFNETTLNTQI